MTQYYTYTNAHKGSKGVRTRNELAALLSHSRQIKLTWTTDNTDHELNFNKYISFHTNGTCNGDAPRVNETSFSFAVRMLGAHAPYSSQLHISDVPISN